MIIRKLSGAVLIFLLTNFAAGSHFPSSNEVRETFEAREINQSSPLDILWVEDDSGSMASKLPKILPAADAFATTLQNKRSLDWKLWLKGLDEGTGETKSFQKVFERMDPTFEKGLGQQLSVLGNTGSGLERLIDSALTTLSSAPFPYRQGVPLAVVMVSDAPDGSIIYNSADAVKRLLGQHGYETENVLFLPFVWPADWCREPSGESFFEFSQSLYATVLGSLNGRHYLLCESELDKNMIHAANTMADFAGRHPGRSILNLKYQPVVGSIRLIHQGAPLDSQLWSYDQSLNAIVFKTLDFVKSTTDSIEIVYRGE